MLELDPKTLDAWSQSLKHEFWLHSPALNNADVSVWLQTVDVHCNSSFILFIKKSRRYLLSTKNNGLFSMLKTIKRANVIYFLFSKKIKMLEELFLCLKRFFLRSNIFIWENTGICSILRIFKSVLRWPGSQACPWEWDFRRNLTKLLPWPSLVHLRHIAGIFWNWIPLMCARSTVSSWRRKLSTMAEWCEAPENTVVGPFCRWGLEKGSSNFHCPSIDFKAEALMI